MNKPSDQDSLELSKFGYTQRLRRTMNAFSSFAISFSLISITTGIFAGFSFGFREVGPIIIWSWTIVLFGQLLMATVIAELSTRFPLAGYGYQWTSRLMNPHYGYFVGWLLLLQFLTGFPGVCYALAEYSHGFFGLPDSFPVSWLTVVIISVIAVTHIAGIRIASLVNDYGVIAEIIGVILITVVLLGMFGFSQETDWSQLFKSVNWRTGEAATFSSFCLSLLMGAWCLTGFEAAADMAEETRNPRKVVPRAVISAELTSGIAGFLMLAGFLIAIPNIESIQASETPLLDILGAHFGSTTTTITMIFVFISIFACGVASMAATTRLIFSLARDNMLPASTLLKSVHATRQSPTGAIAIVALISIAVVLILDDLAKITSVSATAGYLGYSAIALCAFLAKPGDTSGEYFSLGRLRKPICLIAIVWTLGVVAALTIPKIDGGHQSAISTSIGIAAGIILYFLFVYSRIRQGTAGPTSEQDYPASEEAE